MYVGGGGCFGCQRPFVLVSVSLYSPRHNTGRFQAHTDHPSQNLSSTRAQPAGRPRFVRLCEGHRDAAAEVPMLCYRPRRPAGPRKPASPECVIPDRPPLALSAARSPPAAPLPRCPAARCIPTTPGHCAIVCWTTAAQDCATDPLQTPIPPAPPPYNSCWIGVIVSEAQLRAGPTAKATAWGLKPLLRSVPEPAAQRLAEPASVLAWETVGTVGCARRLDDLLVSAHVCIRPPTLPIAHPRGNTRRGPTPSLGDLTKQRHRLPHSAIPAVLFFGAATHSFVVPGDVGLACGRHVGRTAMALACIPPLPRGTARACVLMCGSGCGRGVAPHRVQAVLDGTASTTVVVVGDEREAGTGTGATLAHVGRYRAAPGGVINRRRVYAKDGDAGRVLWFRTPEGGGGGRPGWRLSSAQQMIRNTADCDVVAVPTSDRDRNHALPTDVGGWAAPGADKVGGWAGRRPYTIPNP